MTEQLATSSARIDHSVVMVDSIIAKRWLAKNLKNRVLSESQAERYRQDMACGRWTFAADPIRFSSDGALLDGQTRLTALAELGGVTIPMLVVRGLPAESQNVMDQGRKRTPGDQLGLAGYKSTQQLAASIKQFIAWEEGMFFRDTKVMAAITAPRIVEWADEHPKDILFFQRLGSLFKGNDAPPSIAGAAAIAFGRLDADKAEEFFRLLARGAGTEGHPIVALDKRLQRNRREGLKMPNRDQLALFVTAWNAWRAGASLVKIQRPRGGSWNENNFPEPR